MAERRDGRQCTEPTAVSPSLARARRDQDRTSPSGPGARTGMVVRRKNKWRGGSRWGWCLSAAESPRLPIEQDLC